MFREKIFGSVCPETSVDFSSDHTALYARRWKCVWLRLWKFQVQQDEIRIEERNKVQRKMSFQFITCAFHPFDVIIAFAAEEKNHYHSLTELSPSWETANCAATQDLPSILWNPNVHYRVHKSPPPVPILSHIDSVHTIPSYLYKIHFNIVPPPTSWSS
jgi:hypothetical protein